MDDRSNRMKSKLTYILFLLILSSVFSSISYYIFELDLKNSISIFITTLTSGPIINYVFKKYKE